jgi:hypothetical protein
MPVMTDLGDQVLANSKELFAADVILRGGRIRTMLAEDDVVESIAIKGERILAVGSNQEISDLAGKRTIVVDLGGKTVVPGFIDSHVHLENANRYDRSLDTSTSRADLLERLKAGMPSRNGSWVVFYGRINEPEIWPTKEDLDAMSESRPMVVSLGGSIHILNSEALRRLAPDAESRYGLTIELRTEDSQPNGIIRTVGSDGLGNVLPDAGIGDRASIHWGILKGLSELATAGVTTVGHMIRSLDPIEIYQELRLANSLPMRVGLILRGYESDITLKSILELGLRQGFGNDWLKMQGVKVSLDGYFPDGGAMFTEPYVDEPDCCGHLRISPDEAKEYVMSAHRAGFRCAVHANGDFAVSLALDAYEAALNDTPRPDHRHRIEHVGNLYLTDEHIERLRNTGVVAVPNPPFFHSRAHLMEKRLGPERSRRPVAIGSLLRGGATVAVASDYSGLYPAAPLIGMAGLVTRKTIHGDIFGPEEAIDPWTALRLYTTQAAWLNFDEANKGTIEEGKLADLAVISDDPVTVGADKIIDCEIQATFVGGAPAYSTESWKEELSQIVRGTRQ